MNKGEQRKLILKVIEQWIVENEEGRVWLCEMAEKIGAPVQALFPFVTDTLKKESESAEAADKLEGNNFSE